jgi:hypothetical protein
MSEELKSLRDELLASQTQRYELAKYKLVAVAVLGSVAIGAGGSGQTTSVPYLIGLIPFVCLYLDIIAETKKIQFMVIGSFLSHQDDESILAKYERFCAQNRNVFYQNYSYKYSTLVISFSIFLLGFGRIFRQQPIEILLAVVEISAGLIGVLGSIALDRSTAKRLKLLSKKD